MLDMQNVNKTFGTAAGKVLDEFNLAVRQGEFVSLIGPSGCGKTTALRIVAGLLERSSGTVKVNGADSHGPSREKAIVFQHFNLLPWRTAVDNVAYGLELQGVSKRERLATAREYLDLVGLSAFEKLYPAQLSGGMRQRIGIARALAIHPKLLLMDEPFGALDALTREYLQTQLARIAQERNLTTLFVTHSIDEAIYLSDRVVVMGVQPGRIIAEFTIPFPKPRSEYNFRAEPEYARIREEIWQLLETQIARAEKAGAVALVSTTSPADASGVTATAAVTRAAEGLNGIRSRLFTRANALRAISLLVVGGVWEWWGSANPLFASYPSRIVAAAAEILVPQVLPAFGITLVALFTGLAVATPIGIVVGFAMGRIRLLDVALTPYINAIYATPRIALIPVLVLWLGIDFWLRIAIVALGAVFPIIVNTYAGAKHVDPELLDAGRAFTATPAQTLRTIVLPSSLPYVFAGFRIGIGRAVSGVIVAEMTSALTGIGKLLIDKAKFLLIGEVFVGIMVLGLFSLVLFNVVARAQKRLTPWSNVEGLR